MGGTRFMAMCGGDIQSAANDRSSTKERQATDKKFFAMPGKRKYPIPDGACPQYLTRVAAQNGALL